MHWMLLLIFFRFSIRLSILSWQFTIKQGEKLSDDLFVLFISIEVATERHGSFEAAQGNLKMWAVLYGTAFKGIYQWSVSENQLTII